MAHFAISFELRFGSEIARWRLCDEIERLGGIEAIGGIYLAELDGTPEEVRDYLSRYLGARDRLIVIGFVSPPVMRMPQVGAEKWVAERFTPAAIA